MPKAPARPKSAPRPRFTKGSRRGKVRKEFWLDPQLLKVAQEELGAATEREAVELALDLVAFRRELIQGTRRIRGLQIASTE